jgi:hypothetical protein
LYHKLGIANENANSIQDIILIDIQWIQQDFLMHLPINVLATFDEFIKNHVTLQDVTLGLV